MEGQKDVKNITTNRFIAFLDIMGFKDMVARQRHEEIYSKLCTISQNQSEIENASNGIYTIMFSDSIIMYTENDTLECFINFLKIVSGTFTFLITKSLPAKGSIAYGKLTVDSTKNIFFGQPQIDAYLLQEQEVFYYGVVCHNSIEQYIKTHQKDLQVNDPSNNKTYKELLANQLLNEKTPLKSGEIQHYNLNWFSFIIPFIPKNSTSFTPANFLEYMQQVERQIKSLYTNVSGKPRKYIDNTLSMLEKSKMHYFKQNFS